MTPAKIREIAHRAHVDVRAKPCGYPERAIPYTGEELELYWIEYAKAVEAYKVRK